MASEFASRFRRSEVLMSEVSWMTFSRSKETGSFPFCHSVPSHVYNVVIVVIKRILFRWWRPHLRSEPWYVTGLSKWPNPTRRGWVARATTLHQLPTKWSFIQEAVGQPTQAIATSLHKLLHEFKSNTETITNRLHYDVSAAFEHFQNLDWFQKKKKSLFFSSDDSSPNIKDHLFF